MTCRFFPDYYRCLLSHVWKVRVYDAVQGREQVFDCKDRESACEAVAYISQRIAVEDDLDWFWELADRESAPKAKTRPTHLDHLAAEINTDGYEMAYEDQGCPVG